MSAPVMDAALHAAFEHHASLVRCRVREGLSELTFARVELASAEDLARDEALRSSATLAILRDGEIVRRFSLVVGRVAYLGARGGVLRYELELHPRFWLLGFTRDTRKYRKVAAHDIIATVLDEHDVAHRFELTREPPRRNYCTQYAESDLAFVERLLESEGIFYRFEPDGVLVLSDRSASGPPVPGGRTRYELLEGEGALMNDVEAIHSLSRRLAIGSGKVTVGDFDWKRPKLDLLRSAGAAEDIDGALEIYDYPAGYRNPEDGAHLARTRLEALRVPTDTLRGRSNIPVLAPGHWLEVSADDEDFDGEHLLTTVEHELVRHGFEDAAGDDRRGYHNTFVAIPRAVPFRPEARTPRPTVEGNHTAMVRGPEGEEIHTDSHGRLRVQFHWDREARGTDDDSRWLRLCQEPATSMQLARVGWEVAVTYVDGDPDRPIAVAREINGEMPPTYPLPQKKSVMSIRTPTYPGKGGYNELRLDDEQGRMSFDIKAQRDLRGVTKNDKSERIGNDETHVCTGTLQHVVGRDQTVSIGNDATLQVLVDTQLAVSGDRTFTVGGAETESVGDGQSAVVKGDDTEIVGALRLTLAGSVELPDPAAALAAAVPSVASVAEAALGGARAAVSAATGGVVEKARQALSATSSVADALRSAAGPGGSAAAELAAGSDAIQQWAQSVGNPKEAFGSALASIQQAGGITGVIDVGIEGAVASAGNLLPDPGALLSNATGGLSDAGTAAEALDALLVGTITRSAAERFTRRAGGAFISAVPGGDIRFSGGAIGVETTAGAKITRAGGDISTTVSGPLHLLVGGALRRTARGNISHTATETSVKAGGDALLVSEERIDLRAREVTLEAADELVLTYGDDGAEIRLTPSGISMTRKVRLEATRLIALRGEEDLTA